MQCPDARSCPWDRTETLVRSRRLPTASDTFQALIRWPGGVHSHPLAQTICIEAVQALAAIGERQYLKPRFICRLLEASRAVGGKHSQAHQPAILD